MPHRWEVDKENRFYLQGTNLDRRRKLTEQQKKDIVDDTTHSYRELARMYNVNKNTIMYIKRPESLQENIKRRHERGGSMKYYNKEQHTIQMREYRKRKQQIYILGQLNCLPKEFIKEKDNG